MKTKKAKIRHFFLNCLYWRYRRIRIQARKDHSYRPGWLTLRVDPNFEHHWEELLPDRNITVSIREVLRAMQVPKEVWDLGPGLYGIQYVHVNPERWQL